jgi:hypothetical protein
MSNAKLSGFVSTIQKSDVYDYQHGAITGRRFVCIASLYTVHLLGILSAHSEHVFCSPTVTRLFRYKLRSVWYHS